MSHNNYDNNLSLQENSNLNNHGNEGNTTALNNDCNYDGIHAHEIPNFEKYDEMVSNPLRYEGAENIGDLDDNIMDCNYLTPRFNNNFIHRSRLPLAFLAFWSTTPYQTFCVCHLVFNLFMYIVFFVMVWK